MYLEDGTTLEVKKKIVNLFLKITYILFNLIKFIYIKEKDKWKASVNDRCFHKSLLKDSNDNRFSDQEQ